MDNKDLIPYWRSLAEAVVIQAIKDYHNADHWLFVHRDKELSKGQEYTKHTMMQQKAECERFFKGQWITSLSNCDGETILNYLRRLTTDKNLNRKMTLTYGAENGDLSEETCEEW